MGSRLLRPLATAGWAVFGACAVDVLTLPSSTGAVQLGTRAVLGALSFVLALAASLRMPGAPGRPALYPPAAPQPFPRLRLVHPTALHD